MIKVKPIAPNYEDSEVPFDQYFNDTEHMLQSEFMKSFEKLMDFDYFAKSGNNIVVTFKHTKPMVIGTTDYPTLVDLPEVKTVEGETV